MPKIIFVTHDGGRTEVDAAVGSSLMQAAIENSVEGIVGECGGSAMCATCHCYIEPEASQNLSALSEVEDEMLEGAASERTEQSRLSCQVIVTAESDGLVVQLPESQI